ncbi:MAG: T9SS type A sorting domain-containing protein [Saprospiraceae bacterium]|nr:T9SS type A sorting domain-containing protein [Saprospiraceae bacterium]
MQQKFYFIFFYISFLFLQSKAQTGLIVNDPRNFGGTQPGTIEAASFVIKPQGIYASIEMYLTFSARATYFENGHDTVEVIMDFLLPDKSIIYDSWLWIDTLAVKAGIYDRWTASQVYEEIVGRRQDPSILFKNNDGHYELRIFPMAGNESRKVKISYLVPTDWSKNEVSILLPANILNASYKQLHSIDILMPQTEEWGRPYFKGIDNEFADFNDEDGNFWKTTLDIQEYNGKQNLKLYYSSPLENGVYVNRIVQGDSGIYQMVLLSEEIFDIPAPKAKKIVCLLEYVRGNLVSKQELLQQVKEHLLNNFSNQDSFNIILSRFNTNPVSNSWIPADSISIEMIFSQLNASSIVDYSNIPSMLNSAISFIKNNGKHGEVLLIANSETINTLSAAEQLLEDIDLATEGSSITFYIVDFLNFGSGNRYYKDGRYFLANEYFYLNLAQQSNGYFSKYENNNATLQQNLLIMFEEMNAIKGVLDLRTRLESGVCFNRYEIESIDLVFNFTKPILQVGRFKGDFPFIIEANGWIDTTALRATFTLTENEVPISDTLLQEIWSGLRVEYLDQHQSPIREIILQIIDESLRQRVLSRHTAFMALEPGITAEPCFDCIGGNVIVVSDKDLSIEGLSDVRIAPNPFHERVTIVLEFSEMRDLKDFQFMVYNLAGQQVHSFIDVAVGVTNRLELTWDANQNIAPGVYLFVIQTPQGKYTSKLVKL